MRRGLLENSQIFFKDTSVRNLCEYVSKKTSRISHESFKKLALYSEGYLKKNIDKIACQENESGFLRIGIPLNEEKKNEYPGLEKLRVNYWSQLVKIEIVPESIHTHPGYFESFIITGGYQHALYNIGSNKDELHDCYRILKQGARRTMAFMGKVPIVFSKMEVVRAGEIKAIHLDLIHRVVETMPNTLSLNAVWREESRDYYDLFLTESASPEDDVRTERALLSNQDSRIIIKNIINSLTTIN